MKREKVTGTSPAPGFARRMPMKVACPTCRQVLELPDAEDGLVVNCPACGAALQVPAGLRPPRGAAVTLMPAALPAAAPSVPVLPPPLPYPRAAQAIGDDPAMRMLLPVGRSGWAIAAGYLGLFAVLLLPAPIALIISIVAIRDLKRHPDKHGLGRAIFGLVMGGLGTALLAIMAIGLAFAR